MCGRKGFTLIELLVSIAVISVLMSMLLPTLDTARQKAQSILCVSNLHALGIAFTMYANDNNDAFVPAAEDIDNWDNYHRWHGTRTATDQPFDPRKGPLVPYLGGAAGKVKTCPCFQRMSYKTSAAGNAFEAGCGGYGYNQTFVGSLDWKMGPWWFTGDTRSIRRGATWSDFVKPPETLLFTDCALPMISEGDDYLIEYSFAEPPYFTEPGPDGRWDQPDKDNMFGRPAPSIHFRHVGETANVLWLDGHITSVAFAFTTETNVYGAHNERFHVGWFGPDDFTYFDEN